MRHAETDTGIPDSQLAHMLGLRNPDYVRRYQVQYEGEIIYASPNRADIEYPCDSRPW